MSTEHPSFGHLTLSHRASGERVRLVRSPDEVVLLAFDTQTKRLVELHMLRGGEPMEGALKKSSMERAQQASEIRGPTFMRILEVGEDQGVVYYTSNLNEGEFVSDYVTRRGSLPPATVFSLLLQLLDDVMLLADRHRLVPQLRLDRVMITTVEDTFLQLRLYDFGLGVAERTESDNSRQILQVCELIFLMLTGKSFAGDNPDRYPALTALPMSLRTTVRAALVDPNNTPVSLEKLRDDLREAYSSQVSSIQARNTRKQLVVTAALQPRSQLQDLLLEGVPVERVLGSRFRVEEGENSRRYPASTQKLSSRSPCICCHLRVSWTRRNTTPCRCKAGASIPTNTQTSFAALVCGRAPNGAS
jgi:serine/threonine protein kinase